MSIPDDLTERIRAFQESRVLLAAIELDVFAALGDGATAEQAAAVTHTDPRATGMLLNALVALGVLRKKADVFTNTPDAVELGKARLPMMHIVHLWYRWTTLAECVRTGTAVTPDPAPATADWNAAFIAAMDYNAVAGAEPFVKAVGAQGVRRMLDIGGGSGAYSIAFARANPELHSDILDLEAVVPIARRHIEAAGLSGRIRPTVGDLHQPTYGSGYDLVLISAICHMLSPAANTEMLRKAHAALNAGGRVAIREFILDPGRTGPPQAALFALNMLVGTREGNTYTEEEYSAWLREAGFKDIRRLGPGIMVGTG